MVQAPPKRKKSFPGAFSSREEERKDFFCERDGVAYAGTHLIIDLVRAERLDDLEHIEHTLRRCVEVAGATLLHIHLHHFTPNGGVSGVAVLAESHISIHSWPEYGYAALDIFMCGQTNPRAVHRRLEGGLLASQGGGQGADARQGNEPMERWVEETLHRGFRVRLKADAVLFDSETEHQRLIIFENADFGRVMMLDNIVQLTTKDEFVYHEMMSHVPLFAHGKAKKALIVGGGDGGVLREVLKHPEIEQATLCEIDRGVIDLCRQHFPDMSAGAYDDPRARIVIADGTKFVAETDERFDVIMVDSTDPVGPGAVLFTTRVLCRLRPLPGAGGPARHPERAAFPPGPELKQSVGYFRELFGDAFAYLATTPSYFGGPMSYGWATDNPKLRHHKRRKIERRYEKAGSLPDALLDAPTSMSRPSRCRPMSASWSRASG